MSFVIKQLKRVDFCEEKFTQWSSSSPFSLANFIKIDANLEKKIEEFEENFEREKSFSQSTFMDEGCFWGICAKRNLCIHILTRNHMECKKQAPTQHSTIQRDWQALIGQHTL